MADDSQTTAGIGPERIAEEIEAARRGLHIALGSISILAGYVPDTPAISDCVRHACPTRDTTEAEVDALAQVIRQAHVMAQIGRNPGFTMTPWDTLNGRERAPYVASAVAAFRHWKGL